MGKASKWIKSFLLGGKKDKDKGKHKSSNHPSAIVAENPATPVVIPSATPKDKKRWSFRRSSATAPGPKDSNPNEPTPTKTGPPASSEPPDTEQKKPEVAVAAVTAALLAHVEVPAASSTIIHPVHTNNNKSGLVQEAAAIKIQSVFRSYLARKALRALRGIVKLQALVRGHLVRNQATETLRCMQALVTAQARARAQRIRSVEEGIPYNNHSHSHRHSSTHRMNSQDYNSRNLYHEMEKGLAEENIKIVEMDLGESKGSLKMRKSYTNYQNNDRMDNRFSTVYASQFDYIKQDQPKISPASSAITVTDISPRTCSGHFEDYTKSSPQYYYSAVSRPDSSTTPFAFSFPSQEYAESLSFDYPNYMANTQSSRAKARSQSAPKQRPVSFERQLSRRRPSVEGRSNIPRAVRMQRSSSHVGATAHNYHYPWSIKLDKSTVSLKDSECGSTCSVRTNTNTNTNYCRSVVSYDVSETDNNYTKGIENTKF